MGGKKKNFWSSFTIKAKIETGTTHIAVALRKNITYKENNFSLLQELFIEVGNCCREQKTHYFFEFQECLFAWGVFAEVEVAVLPVGHTHEDVDQDFRRTSYHSRLRDAITISDLHDRVRETYNGQDSVSEMEAVINWCGLCINEKFTKKAPLFFHFRYFKYSRRRFIRRDALA